MSDIDNDYNLFLLLIAGTLNASLKNFEGKKDVNLQVELSIKQFMNDLTLLTKKYLKDYEITGCKLGLLEKDKFLLLLKERKFTDFLTVNEEKLVIDMEICESLLSEIVVIASIGYLKFLVKNISDLGKLYNHTQSEVKKYKLGEKEEVGKEEEGNSGDMEDDAEEEEKDEDDEAEQNQDEDENEDDEKDGKDEEKEIQEEKPLVSEPTSRKRSISPSSSVQQHKRFQHIAVNLINSIQAHRFSSPFLQPVNPKDAPDYAELIYEPKDLKNIMKSIKLKSEPPEYQLLEELERDIMLMFANCIMYNKSDTDLVQLTKSMKNDVNNIFKLFKEAELDTR